MSQRRTSRDQPHLPIPIHARYRRCDPQKLLHIEAPTTYLTHLSLGTYVRTYIPFILLHNGNLFYHFNCYLHRSFTRSDSDTDTETASQNTLPDLTYPEFSSHQSIQSVNWSLAVSDSRSKTHKRHPGGGIANNEGELPCYPLWVISQTGAAQWVDGRLAMVVVYVCYS